MAHHTSHKYTSTNTKDVDAKDNDKEDNWQCKCSKKDQLKWFTSFITLIAVITSIVAIIIVLTDTHPHTNCDSAYVLIDSALFIMIGAISTLSLILLLCGVRLVALFIIKSLHLSGEIIIWILLLFNSSWCIIGFFIFSNQCNVSKTPTEVTAILWSIIIFIVTVSYYICFVRFYYPFVVVSMAAIIVCIITLKSGNTLCNDEYIIFTMIGSALSVFHVILVAVLRWKHRSRFFSHDILTWIMSVFYLCWSLLGFSIFRYGMSYKCKNDTTGKVMISWCIIMFCCNVFWWIKYLKNILIDLQDVYQSTFYFVVFYPIATVYIGFMIPSLYIYIYYGDHTVCNEKSILFSMNPPLFTVIATVVSSAYIVWMFVCSFRPKTTKKSHSACTIMNHILFCIVLVFMLFWCILGFYSYHNEMSSACKHHESSIAAIMIAWCIITFIAIFCILFTEWIYDVANVDMLVNCVVFSLLSLFFGFMIPSINKYYGQNTECYANYSLIEPMHFILIGTILNTAHILVLWLLWRKTFAIVLIMSLVLFLFYIIWSIIGFYIYANEMSSECKQEDIGWITIIWSVLVFVASCLMTCFIFIYVLNRLYKNKKRFYKNDFILPIYFVSFVVSSAVMIVGMAAYYGDDSVCQHGEESVEFWKGFSLRMGATFFTMFFGFVTTLHSFWELLDVFAKKLIPDELLCIVKGRIAIFMFLFYFVWCIIGFVIYGTADDECKQSVMGEMMIVWCIFYFVFSCLFLRSRRKHVSNML